MIKRHIQKEIEKAIIHNDYSYNNENFTVGHPVIILYGSRQSGKTTIVSEIAKIYPETSKYINCELINNKVVLENIEENTLKSYTGNKKILILDEVQKLGNAEFIIKTIVDKFPEKQLIITSSTSFELLNKDIKFLENNSLKYFLYPFSLQDVCGDYDIHSQSFIKNVLRFGMYPEVFTALYSQSEFDAQQKLEELLSYYLFKDIFELDNAKKTDLIIRILQVLAIKIGSEISLNELATLLDMNNHTLSRYLYLLEQSFIIFSLSSYNKNLKKEVGKKYKFYFYDLGVRNCIIQNLNHLDIRNDVDELWENFCIVERLKYNQYINKDVNSYFWKTYDGQNIDYVEEDSNRLNGFKFKWGKELKPFRPPKAFIENYENASVKKIDQHKYIEFLFK